jgi:hypothetical protein
VRVGWITDANGCDIWQGSRINGYAMITVARKTAYVYRVRYEREIGPIPEGMELDHFVCDNGPGGCCNPHHCRPVTRRENVLRSTGFASTNAAKTHCPKGHLLSGDNLIPSKLAKRGRNCRMCYNAQKRASYHSCSL